MTSILQALSCADDYDPNSLHVDRARQLILDLLPAVSGHERVFVRQALDRVLSEDVISPIDVPSPRQLGHGRLGGALRQPLPPMAKRG
jgi:molybdopterin molybdotransferase